MSTPLNFRRRWWLPVVLAATLLIAACGNGGAGDGGTQTWRLAHCCAADSHFDYGAHRFAELVEQYSDGKIKVDVFPDGQLGQETEVIQSVQRGTIELTLIGHDPLAQFAEVTTLLSMPYLFDDHEHAFGLLEGDLGAAISDALSPALPGGAGLGPQRGPGLHQQRAPDQQAGGPGGPAHPQPGEPGEPRHHRDLGRGRRRDAVRRRLLGPAAGHDRRPGERGGQHRPGQSAGSAALHVHDAPPALVHRRC